MVEGDDEWGFLLESVYPTWAPWCREGVRRTTVSCSTFSTCVFGLSQPNQPSDLANLFFGDYDLTDFHRRNLVRLLDLSLALGAGHVMLLLVFAGSLSLSFLFLFLSLSFLLHYSYSS